MTTTWTFDLDADDDGTFSEDLFSYMQSLDWMIGFDQPFQHVPGESVLNATLRNIDGRFNPENASSDLYGKLTAGKLVRVTANGTSLWRGYLDEVVPQWDRAGDYTGKLQVTLRAVGMRQVLQEHLYDLPLQQDKRADEILNTLLNNIIPPSAVPGSVWLLEHMGASEIGTTTFLGDIADVQRILLGDVTFGYYGDIRALEKDEADAEGKEMSAWRIIRDMAEADCGKFIPGDRSGRALYWNRHYLRDKTTLAGTVADDGSGNIRPIDVQYDWDKYRVNRASVTYFQRTAGQTDLVLWTQQEAYTIPAGGFYIIDAPLRDETNQLSGATNLRLNVDWSGDAKVEDRGGVAVITLFNSGTVPFIASGFEVLGDILESHDRTTVEVEDTASVLSYRRKAERRITTRAEMGYQDAADWCDFHLQNQKDPQGVIRSLTFFNRADDVDNAWQLARTLGDRIRYSSSTGHDREHFVIGERHKLQNATHLGEMHHTTTLYLEPAHVTDLARYDKQFVSADVAIGKTSGADRLAQSFTISRSLDVKHVRLWLHKVGDPSGYVQAVIETDNAGQPSGTRVSNAISDNTNMSDLTGDYGWVTFTFATPPSLSASTTYWIVLEAGDANLVSYWQLEESSGDALDAWGDNDLTDNNTVTQAASGKVGDARQFTRTNSEYFNITDAAQSGLDITGSLTIGAWIYLDSLPLAAGANFAVLGKYGAAGSRSYVLLINAAANRAQFFVSLDGTTTSNVQATDFGALSTGTWYFIVCRYDGTNIKISVNGTETTALYSSGIADKGGDFQIGAIAGGSNFDGRIDEAFVFNTAISDAYSAVLYNSGSGLIWQQASYTEDADNYLEMGADDQRHGFYSSLVDAYTFDTQDSPGLSYTGNNDLTQGGTVTQPPASQRNFDLAKPFDNQGLKGLCAQFDGASSLTLADNAAFSGTAAMTIAGYFYMGTAGVEMDVLGKWDAANNERSYLVKVTSSDALQFLVSNDGTAEHSITAGDTLIPYRWYHYVSRYTGGSLEVRVNDSAFAGTAYSSGIYDGTAPLVIGASGSGTANYFTGLQDEVGFWSGSAWTDTQADFAYNSHAGRQIHELFGYTNGQMMSLASGTWSAENKDGAFEVRMNN